MYIIILSSSQTRLKLFAAGIAMGAVTAVTQHAILKHFIKNYDLFQDTTPI